MEAAQRYRFVSEGSLKLETMIAAARLAATALLACDTIPKVETVEEALQWLVAAQRSDNHLSELEALRILDSVLPDNPTTPETQYGAIVRALIKTVWGYVFMHYFWLKERR